jgi:hypothetical protein
MNPKDSLKQEKNQLSESQRSELGLKAKGG